MCLMGGILPPHISSCGLKATYGQTRCCSILAFIYTRSSIRQGRMYLDGFGGSGARCFLAAKIPMEFAKKRSHRSNAGNPRRHLHSWVLRRSSSGLFLPLCRPLSKLLDKSHTRRYHCEIHGVPGIETCFPHTKQNWARSATPERTMHVPLPRTQPILPDVHDSRISARFGTMTEYIQKLWMTTKH